MSTTFTLPLTRYTFWNTMNVIHFMNKSKFTPVRLFWNFFQTCPASAYFQVDFSSLLWNISSLLWKFELLQSGKIPVKICQAAVKLFQKWHLLWNPHKHPTPRQIISKTFVLHESCTSTVREKYVRDQGIFGTICKFATYTSHFVTCMFVTINVSFNV